MWATGKSTAQVVGKSLGEQGRLAASFRKKGGFVCRTRTSRSFSFCPPAIPPQRTGSCFLSRPFDSCRCFAPPADGGGFNLARPFYRDCWRKLMAHNGHNQPPFHKHFKHADTETRHAASINKNVFLGGAGECHRWPLVQPHLLVYPPCFPLFFHLLLFLFCSTLHSHSTLFFTDSSHSITSSSPPRSPSPLLFLYLPLVFVPSLSLSLVRIKHFPSHTPRPFA